MTTGIYIGTSPDLAKEAVKLVSLIMKSNTTDKTKQAAFAFLLNSLRAPSNVSISNCSINV